MNTKDIIKYVLIAAGAYLLYRWLSDNGYLSSFGIGASTTTDKAIADQATADAAAKQIAAAQAIADKVVADKAIADKTAADKAAADAATLANIPSKTAVSSTTRDLVAVLSQGDSFLSGGGANGHGPFEHWNYYYNQTPQGKALPAPDPGTAGVDPNASITLDQWWALVSAHGISGLNGGLGNALWLRGPWGIV